MQRHHAAASTSILPLSDLLLSPPFGWFKPESRGQGSSGNTIHRGQPPRAGVGWTVADMDLRERGKWRAIITEGRGSHNSWNVRAGGGFSSSRELKWLSNHYKPNKRHSWDQRQSSSFPFSWPFHFIMLGIRSCKTHVRVGLAKMGCLPGHLPLLCPSDITNLLQISFLLSPDVLSDSFSS